MTILLILVVLLGLVGAGATERFVLLPRRKPVRLWHPDSPGARVAVQPCLRRQLGMVDRFIATGSEMRRYHRTGPHYPDGTLVTKDGRIILPPTREEQIRTLEHQLGVGPFWGREDYCDLTKCKGGKDGHDHEDVDEETMTGRAVVRPDAEDDEFLPPEPRPARRAPGSYLVHTETVTEDVYQNFPEELCHDPDHEHENIRSWDGTTVTRRCIQAAPRPDTFASIAKRPGTTGSDHTMVAYAITAEKIEAARYEEGSITKTYRQETA